NHHLGLCIGRCDRGNRVGRVSRCVLGHGGGGVALDVKDRAVVAGRDCAERAVGGQDEAQLRLFDTFVDDQKAVAGGGGELGDLVRLIEVQDCDVVAIE